MRIQIFAYVLILVLAITTISSAVPIISNVSPVDNATNIPLDNAQVYLKANITDAQGLKYVAFQTNKTGTWTTIAEVSLSGNWSTTVPIAFSGLQPNTKYWWRIKAESNNNTWTNTSIYSFTTQETSTSQNITIVPSQPRANKNIVFVVNTNDASGYIICYETGDVYMVEIKNGVGLVELGMEYGLAQVNIIGYGTRTFSIASPYSGGVLSINAPSDAEVNKKIDISVTAQGEAIQANVDMVSPTGRKMSRITGTEPIQISFDEVGKWNITAKVYDTTVSRIIQVVSGPLTIAVPDEAKAGEEITIETSKEAVVTIVKGDVSWTYIADDNGEVFFTPLWAGRYEVTAETSDQRKSENFNVKADTTILIKNEEGNPVDKISNGDILFIQLVDTQGQLVVDASEITAYSDSLQIAVLTLYGGTAIWRVTASATDYNFEFSPSDTALYLPATLSIPGGANSGGVDALYYYIGGIAVIVIVIIVILQYTGRIDLRSLLPSKEEDPLL